MQQTEELKALFAGIKEFFDRAEDQPLTLIERDILMRRIALLYEHLSDIQPENGHVSADQGQRKAAPESTSEHHQEEANADSSFGTTKMHVLEDTAEEDFLKEEELPVQEVAADPVMEETITPIVPTETEKDSVVEMSRDKTIINESLSADKKTLADKIHIPASGSLKKQMDVNARFFFTKELFGNNQDAFDKAVRFIDNLGSLEDANIYIEKELAVKYNWERESKARSKFNDAVRLRFNG